MAVVTVALFAAATAFAAMNPMAPQAARRAMQASSPGGPGAMLCTKNTELTPVFPLVMCIEAQDNTQDSWGNGYPWENSTFFFASYRNQYLWPSSTMTDMLKTTVQMDSLHSRGTSFMSSATNIYGSFRRGANSIISVGEALTDTLVIDFDLNPAPGTEFARLEGSSTTPFTIGSFTGPNGTVLSTCAGGISPNDCPPDPDCPDPETTDCWARIGKLPGPTNVLLDQIVAVASGSGSGVWDMTGGPGEIICPEPQRAYGSTSFYNLNWLTTAFGVDDMGFIWVFSGVGPPPPATVEQQIKEIVRLLLTPEGLRCSGLDLVPGNGLIEDTPIMYPNGQFVDPIQPQVTTGQPVTGDELIDDVRKSGWQP
jgi:hypothetical protein